MRRGEIWTVSGGADYAGKPRPAVVVQSNQFDATPSITICLLTTEAVDAAPARFVVTPSSTNGLQRPSHAMVDKISTIPRAKAGRRIGHLDNRDIASLDRALALFLGLAD